MSSAYSQGDVHVPHDVGPVLQAALSAAQLSLAVSIPISGSVVSGLQITNGYKNFAFAATSSQAGSISIQRFIDTSGNIKQGSPLTASLTANTPAVINLNDTLAFQSLQITITNSSGSVIASLTNVMLLFQAN